MRQKREQAEHFAKIWIAQKELKEQNDHAENAF